MKYKIIKNSFIIIFTLILIHCNNDLFAQPVTFKKVFSTCGSQKMYCISYNNDKTFIISTTLGLFKLNINGDILIQRQSSGKIVLNKNDTTFSLFLTSGYSKGFLKVDTLIKAIPQFYIFYNNVNYSYGFIPRNIIFPAINNCYIIGGWRADTTLFFKIDSVGNVLWNRYFSPLQGGGVSAIIQTADSGLVVASGFNNNGACLIKTNANGIVLWAKSYVRPKGYITSVIENPDNTLLISGITDSTLISPYTSNMFLIKTSSTGNVIWAKTFGDNNTFRNHKETILKKTPEGGYIILASLARSNANPAIFRDNLVLIKTDINGDTLWTRAHGSNNVNIWATDIDVLHDGYLIAANTNNAYPVPYYCDYLIRSDSLGHTASLCEEYSPQISVNSFSVNDSAIILSSVPFIIDTTLVTPYNNITNNYAYSGCYLNEIYELLQGQDTILSIYPNPCNGLFTLEFNNSNIITTEIEVYNSNGQKIYSLSETGSSCNIDISEFAKGLYFIRAINENGIKTGKVMVE